VDGILPGRGVNELFALDDPSAIISADLDFRARPDAEHPAFVARENQLSLFRIML
jgi:hypothetical protein